MDITGDRERLAIVRRPSYKPDIVSMKYVMELPRGQEGAWALYMARPCINLEALCLRKLISSSCPTAIVPELFPSGTSGWLCPPV